MTIAEDIKKKKKKKNENHKKNPKETHKHDGKCQRIIAMQGHFAKL